MFKTILYIEQAINKLYTITDIVSLFLEREQDCITP